MKKKRKVGGNIERASIAPTRNFITESQRATLRDEKYKLQAELRQRTDSPKAKGIKTSGRPSAFIRVPLNPATKPATKKFVNPRPRPKAKTLSRSQANAVIKMAGKIKKK